MSESAIVSPKGSEMESGADVPKEGATKTTAESFQDFLKVCEKFEPALNKDAAGALYNMAAERRLKGVDFFKKLQAGMKFFEGDWDDVDLAQAADPRIYTVGKMQNNKKVYLLQFDADLVKKIEGKKDRPEQKAAKSKPDKSGKATKPDPPPSKTTSKKEEISPMEVVQALGAELRKEIPTLIAKAFEQESKRRTPPAEKTPKETKKAETPKDPPPKAETPTPTPTVRAPKSYSDVSTLVREYTHRVPEDPATLDAASVYGIPVHKSKNATKVGHPISHLCRSAAFMRVLETEGKGLKEVHILDWYGADRNVKDVEYLNSISTDSHIKITVAPNDPYQGDNARASKARRPLNPDLRYNFVMVQDVYSYGSSALDEWTPENIIKLCKLTTSGNVYFIIRFFDGEAGWDRTSSTPEMVWYRSEGLIHASPEPGMSSYPGHPDLNWLRRRHLKGLDIAHMNAVGPYQIIRCTEAAPDSGSVGPEKLVDPEIVFMDLNNWRYKRMYQMGSLWNQTFLSWVYEMPSPEPLLVHRPVWSVLSSQYQSRLATGQALDSVNSTVESKLAADPGFVEFRKRYPVRAQQLVRDTAKAVLYVGREDAAAELEKMRQLTSDSEQALKRARAQTYEISSFYKLMQIVGMVLAASFFLYFRRRRMGRISKGSAMEAAQEIRAKARNHALNVMSEWDLMGGILSPMVEEIVKYFFPKATAVIILFEFLATSFTLGPMAYFPALAMHLSTYFINMAMKNPISLLFNILMHGSFNFGVYRHNQRLMGKSTQKDFEVLYEQGKRIVDSTSKMIPLPADIKLPSLQSAPGYIEILRGKMTALFKGQPVSPGALTQILASSNVRPSYVYPLLITSGLLHRPQKTPLNLMTALVTRIHNDPFKDCPKAELRHEKWERLGVMLVDSNILGGTIDTLPTLEEATRPMGSKGKRILEANLKDLEGNNHILKKEMMLKQDETISPTKNLGGEITIKPRSIVNLDPIYHSRSTQWAKAFANRLHEKLNEGTIHIWKTTEGDLPVCVVFCSGYTGQKLSSLSENLCDVNCVTILVNGDDSYVHTGRVTKTPMYLEGDMAMFDQSQDEGPLRRCFPQWAASLGMPEELIILFLESCSRPYKARLDDLVITGEAGTQLSTGVTLTTVVNSVNNMLMWLYILSHRFVDCSRRALELGFTLKLKEHTSIEQGTFLKGWWVQNLSGGYDWVVLPSMVLKLGKVMNDPRSITKVRRNGKVFHFDDAKARAIVAMGVVLSSGRVPRNYPILGAFLTRMSQLGEWHSSLDSRKIMPEDQQYKVFADTEGIDRPAVLSAIHYRYGLTPDDVERVENLLLSVSALPALVVDPVFVRLAEVDYD